MASDKRSSGAGPPPSQILAGRRPVLELLRAGKTAERILIAKEPSRSNVVGEIRRRAEDAGVPVRFVPKTEIDRAAGDINHQGVVAFTARFRYTPLEDLLAAPGAGLLFLDGVTDPQNLGSLLRSADGAGLGGIVIPSHRSAGVTDVVRRVSAGAAEVVPIARVVNLGRALDDAKQTGIWVVGLDGRADEDLWTADLLEPPVALVLGAEDRGISQGIRRRCDGLVRIPSSGRLDSLNAAVAGAVAMFELARRKAGSATL